MKFNISGLAQKLPTGVSRRIGRAGLVGQKHSPAILFGAGVIGVVATVVIASRATLKLDEVLAETNANLEKAEITLGQNLESYTESDYKNDIIKIRSAGIMQIARLYTPALMVGMVSIAALTGSHVVLTRRNFALTAAYAALEKGYDEYRRRVIDEYGAEKDHEFNLGVENREVQEKTADGDTKKHNVKYLREEGRGSQYARFFSKEGSSEWKSDLSLNQMFVQTQQNYANNLLKARGHVFLNEVYDMLGMERSKAGAVVGWVWQAGTGDDYIDFGIFRDNNRYNGQRFVNGNAVGILLDFNVDGVIYDKI